MNLFRSEEHVRNWGRFKSGTEEGIVQISELLQMFSSNFFRRRLDPDYVSRYAEYIGEFIAALAEMGKVRPFWAPRTP